MVDVGAYSDDVKLTLASLQGIVNRDSPRLLLVYSEGDRVLAEYLLEDILGCMVDPVRGGFTEVIARYRDMVRGVIVYNPDINDTINLALSLAGLESAIVASPDKAELLARMGLEIIHNLANEEKDKINVYSEVLNLMPYLNQSAIAILKPGLPRMADYVVKHRLPVLYLSPLPDYADERSLLEEALKKHNGRIAMGFFPHGGAGEKYGVDLLSMYGKTLIVADHASSLSFYEWLSGDLKLAVPVANEARAPEPAEGVYAALIISDGDNIGFLQHILPTRQWWNNPYRGTIPLGWTLNPWTVKLAPHIVSYLTATATQNDELVSGVAGVGYINPLKAPEDALEELVAYVEPLVDASGLRTAYFWTPLGDRGLEAFRGVYDSYYRVVYPEDPGYPGFTVWMGKPVIHAVHVSLDNYRQVIDRLLSINQRPLLLAFSIDVWSFGSLHTVAEMAEYLEEKGVVLVKPRELASIAERYYSLFTKPWFAIVSSGDLISLRLDGCTRMWVYSSVSGDLLAVNKPDPMLDFNGHLAWASNLGECSVESDNNTARIVFSSNDLTIERVYSVEGSLLVIETSINGSVSMVTDAILDQLDTIIWPVRGLAEPLEGIGPRYAYAQGTLYTRPLGIDPYTICINCNSVIIFDAAYPYPRSIGVYIDGVNATIIDAFSRGDADGDGVGEIHSIAARIPVGEGLLRYRVVVAFMSHGWNMRLPLIQDPLLLAEHLLEPTLEDLIMSTGYLESIRDASFTAVGHYTTTVTETKTHTTTITKHLTQRVTSTRIVTETVTMKETYTKTETETVTNTLESTETITLTTTITEMRESTERTIDPLILAVLAGVSLLAVALALRLGRRF